MDTERCTKTISLITLANSIKEKQAAKEPISSLMDLITKETSRTIKRMPTKVTITPISTNTQVDFSIMHSMEMEKRKAPTTNSQENT